MQKQEVIIRNPLALNEDALGENVVVIDVGDYIFLDEPKVASVDVAYYKDYTFENSPCGDSDCEICESISEDADMLKSTDFAARKVLSANFYDCAGVFVRKHRAHILTQDEWQAINYLCDEWDYGYEGGWVTE